MRSPLRFFLAVLVALVALGQPARAQYPDAIWVRGGQPSAVISMAYSPDSQRLAVAGDDGSVRVYDATSRALFRYIPKAQATAIAWLSADQIIVGGVDGNVRIYNVTTGELVRTIAAHVGSRINAVTLSPNGALIATGAEDASAKLISTSNWSVTRTLSGHTAGVTSVTFTPDNASLLTGSADKSLKLWNATSGAAIRTYTDASIKLTTAGTITSDGKWVVAMSGQCFTTSAGCGITVFDLATGAVKTTSGPAALDVVAVAAGPAGANLIATVGQDAQGAQHLIYGAVFTYDVAAIAGSNTTTNRLPGTRRLLGGSNAPIRALAFAPNGSALAVAGDDRVIRTINPSTFANEVFIDQTRPLVDADYSTTANVHVSVDNLGNVSIRNLADGALRDTAGLGMSNASGIALMPDGSLAIVAGDESSRVVNVATGAALPPTSLGATVTAVALSADGKRGALALAGQGVKIVNPTNLAQVSLIPDLGAMVNAVALSSDGKYVAIGLQNDSVFVYDVTNGSRVLAVGFGLGGIVDVAFSGDDARLAAANGDVVRTYALPAGTFLAEASGHTDVITGVAFTEGNDHVITSSRDGSLRVWSALSGFNTYTYDVYDGEQLSVASHGTTVTSTTLDGTAILWTLKTGTTAGELAAPLLSTPTNAATSVITPTVVYWHSVAGASRYAIDVSTESTFTSGLIASEVDVTDTSFVLATLSAGTTYYWRVRAISDDGMSPWSATWSFTTIGGTSLGKPSLLSPADKATEQPLDVLLRWGAATGAETYRVQISTDENDFSNPVFDQENITGTEVRASGLQTNTTYYWRARAVAGGKSSTWTLPAWSFTTVAITGVDNGEMNRHLKVRVTPNRTGGPTRLALELDRVATLRISIVDLTGRLLMAQAPRELPEGANSLELDLGGLPTGRCFVRVEGLGTPIVMPVDIVR